MNRKGQTTGYKVSNYLKELIRFLGEDIFDFVLVNNQKPDSKLIEVYSEEGELVMNDLNETRIIESALLGEIEKGAYERFNEKKLNSS